MSIQIESVSKSFGQFRALSDIHLHVKTGELVALLGPSGSGKTTLLRIIAGLEQPDAGSGSIAFHDEDVAARPVRERQVGFVFQHYALFRHMSVFGNVAFGLQVRPRKLRPSKSDIRQRVHELLKLVQLEGLADRYPSQLSGGQRQRVALARALAVEPKVLLLDEPFGALDAKVRKELRDWLRHLHDEIHVTSVFVTHDQDEALEVADRVVVMNRGTIEQIGTPEEVFRHPRSEFVMDFLGQVNRFHGRIEQGKAIFGSIVIDTSVPANADGKDARLFVRPHDLELTTTSDDQDAIPVRIVHIQAAGAIVRVHVFSHEGQSLQVEMSHEQYRRLNLHMNATVHLRVKSSRIFVDDYVI